MKIPTDVKEAVKTQLLGRLEKYWEEAEWHEDDSSIVDPNVQTRIEDFLFWLNYEGV